MEWVERMDEGVEVLDGEEQVKACRKVVELNLRISQWLSYHMMEELISKVLHPLSVSK